MNRRSVQKAIHRISHKIEENKELLTEMDARFGDGDLGVSMYTGLSAVADLVDGLEEEDLGKIFMKCAGKMNETAPSSLGTILSFGMMGMAKSLKGRTEMDMPDLALAMEKGIAMIMEKAKSRPGEKTILDALMPGVEALLKFAETEDALDKAAEAAAAGAENTRNMQAVHGRAAYYKEKSIGFMDGGAVVGKLIFEGMAVPDR